MKVGFAGRWNPLDKNAWSGIYFHTSREIKKYAELESFHYKWPWHVRERLILYKQYQKLQHKNTAVEFLTGYARWFSRQLEKELHTRKVDILFVPSAPQLIAYCKTKIPIVYLTDATFFQLQGYYDSFNNLSAGNIRQGTDLDKRAFDKATHCMLASDWAKQSAVKDYDIAESKITVVPFGANFDAMPVATEVKKEKNKVCKLLFLGVEWERKGGPIVLETFNKLKAKGFPVELTIIGCTPPGYIAGKNDVAGITVIPFLNRQLATEAATLYDITRHSDFLFVPSRAECAGIVFCEASAFGVPSITTDTGGVSTNVQDGINGFALPLAAGAAEYAEKIEQLFFDDDAYWLLSRTSRKKFEEDLNWENWGRTFYSIAEKILNK